MSDSLLKTAGGLAILRALNSLPDIANLMEVSLSGNELSGDDFLHEMFKLINRPDKASGLKFELSSNNFGEDAVDRIRVELSDQKVALLLT